MNANELRHYLDNNDCTKRYFRGVYACDNIKEYRKYPYFIIVNTDNARKEGEHWLVLFYTQPLMLEIFDSLGMDLKAYKCLSIYLAKTPQRQIERNDRLLQSPFSNLCGAHCLLYCHIKCCYKIALQTILNRYYIKDVDFNDCKVLYYMRKLYSLKSDVLKKMLITTANKCE